MIHNMFTIYDSKAEAYLPPFVLPEKAMAIRSFSDCANDPTHAFYRNPGDYTLMHIGTYDDATAKISTLKTPISLGVAQEYKKQQSFQEEQMQFNAFDDKVEADTKGHNNA